MPVSIVACDLNADGLDDLATANIESNDVSVFMNSGNGSFAVSSLEPGGFWRPLEIIADDFNADGVLDLAAGSFDDVAIFIGNGDESYQVARRYGAGSASLLSADLNSDMLADLVTTSDVVQVLLNEGCQVLLGDINGDSVVNLLDVAPFIDLLVNQEFMEEADVNMDGFVNLLDINPFIDLLIGQ